MPELLVAGRPFESVLLAASLPLVASVIGSRVSTFAGLPALLVFLGVGMLAGSEGPGGIEFTNYPLTFALGSVALAFILFDGGMRARWQDVRPVLCPGVSLASLGVMVTAAVTAVFARYALRVTWTEALLIGAIVSSTDAAAVFSVLRAKSLSLKGKVKQVLEFEAAATTRWPCCSPCRCSPMPPARTARRHSWATSSRRRRCSAWAWVTRGARSAYTA